MTEAPLNPRSNRDIAAQIFFDTFNVPALYISVQAVLSLSVHAHSSYDLLLICVLGIRQVVQRVSSWIPGMASHMLYQFLKDFRCRTLSEESTSREGIPTTSKSSLGDTLIIASIGTSPITYNCYSGKPVTIYTRQPNLKSFVPSRKSPVTLPSTRKRRRRNRRAGRKTSSYQTETPYRYSARSPVRIHITDGFSYHPVQLGPERFRAPEILFNPELIGQEYAGVHQVVLDAINRVDLDLRKSLFSNIVLSGGSTLCRGDTTVATKDRPCR